MTSTERALRGQVPLRSLSSTNADLLKTSTELVLRGLSQALASRTVRPAPSLPPRSPLRPASSPGSEVGVTPSAPSASRGAYSGASLGRLPHFKNSLPSLEPPSSASVARSANVVTGSGRSGPRRWEAHLFHLPLGLRTRPRLIIKGWRVGVLVWGSWSALGRFVRTGSTRRHKTRPIPSVHVACN